MKNILIIDDDELVCRLISKLIQPYDVLITNAKNGQEANKLLQDNKKYDVIFLDLILPYISGWDLLTVIRNDPATKNTPVIIITGFSLSHEETEKLEGKVSAVISKTTFKRAEFETLMKKLL